MRSDAPVGPIQTYRFTRGALIAAGSTAAFVAGMLSQRLLVPNSLQISPNIRLAQISQGHSGGNSALAPLRHHASYISSGGADSSPDDPAATLETVYSLVKEHFVDTLPTDSAMSHGALRSLLSALHDPNAFFLDPAQRTLLANEAQGKFSGIGASLYVRPVSVNGFTEHKIEIVSALPGSPAQKAGLRPHDVITHIDGKWILGTDPFLKVDNLVARLQASNQSSNTDKVERATEEARRRASGGMGLIRAEMALRGDQPTLNLYQLPADRLTLTVLSPGLRLPRTVELEPRETDVGQAVLSSTWDGTAVMKIPAFTNSTADAVRKTLKDTTASSSGLLLDLRGNAGGIGGNGSGALKVAQKVASLLAAPSVHSVDTEFANERLPGRKTLTLRLTPASDDFASSCNAVPIVVLVDEGTAGAAEALAVALSDCGRATLIGQRTFGYAGVQTVYDLPDGSGFTLSTGRLSSPKNVDWSGHGLAPAVALPANASEAEIMSRAASLLVGRRSARIAVAPPSSVPH